MTLATANSLDAYRAAGGDPHSSANQNILRDLVGREVVHCVSSLVYHFSQNPDALTGSDYSYDDLIDLCRNSDYKTAAENAIDEWDGDELAEYLDMDKPGDDDWTDFQIKTMRADAYEAAASEGYDDFCQEQDIEPEENEVYEHWIVSDFFRRKLGERGETVTSDFFGLSIWGRCCTGQAILLDEVIADIAAEMQILEGQPHDWSKRS